MSLNLALQNFCSSFAAKDAAAVARVFEETGLFEFPFAAQRLVGRREIENGMSRMLENLDSVSFDLGTVRNNERLAIGEGAMTARRAGGHAAQTYPLSIVVEQGASGAARIAVYFDTFGERPWLDGLVFAAG